MHALIIFIIYSIIIINYIIGSIYNIYYIFLKLCWNAGSGATTLSELSGAIDWTAKSTRCSLSTFCDQFNIGSKFPGVNQVKYLSFENRRDQIQ